MLAIDLREESPDHKLDFLCIDSLRMPWAIITIVISIPTLPFAALGQIAHDAAPQTDIKLVGCMEAGRLITTLINWPEVRMQSGKEGEILPIIRRKCLATEPIDNRGLSNCYASSTNTGIERLVLSSREILSTLSEDSRLKIIAGILSRQTAKEQCPQSRNKRTSAVYIMHDMLCRKIARAFGKHRLDLRKRLVDAFCLDDNDIADLQVLTALHDITVAQPDRNPATRMEKGVQAGSLDKDSISHMLDERDTI